MPTKGTDYRLTVMDHDFVTDRSSALLE